MGQIAQSNGWEQSPVIAFILRLVVYSLNKKDPLMMREVFNQRFDQVCATRPKLLLQLISPQSPSLVKVWAICF